MAENVRKYLEIAGIAGNREENEMKMAVTMTIDHDND